VKFFFGFLAFIAATIVVVLLIISLFRSLGSNSSDNTISSTYSFSEPNAINSVVRYTVAGPIVAEEDYREVKITVSQNVRTFEVIKGFNNTVITTKSYQNNPEAYRAFLGALTAAEFADRRENSTDNPESTCVTGVRFFFELNEASDKPVDTWTSDCSLNHGTFAGNQQGTAQIFRGQIPDYNTLIVGVNIRSL
jgi:hypothetical protein